MLQAGQRGNGHTYWEEGAKHGKLTVTQSLGSFLGPIIYLTVLFSPHILIWEQWSLKPHFLLV